MKTYYHATRSKNRDSILQKGILKSVDGVVYLCEKLEDSLKFALLRIYDENIDVFEVKVNESDIVETFDHSYNFFKCRCFGSTKDIKPSAIVKCYEFDNQNEFKINN